MAQKNLNRGLRPTGRVMMLIMLAFFLVLFVITGVSFAMIAHTGSVREEDLLNLALQTQLGERTIHSRRGMILDRNGNVVSTQLPAYTMYANFHPDWGSIVENIEYTARKLAEVIDMEVDELIEILSQEDVLQPRFGMAGNRMSLIQKNKIEALALPGIYFISELTRLYPLGTFASHTIGYTWFGEDGSSREPIGAMGLEAYLNDLLMGTNGLLHFKRDRYGFNQPGSEPVFVHEPLDGYDVTLTIDATIQGFVESALDDVVKQASPENIVAIVMDPRTGEILAAASRPTFNPNNSTPESYANAIMYPFEPGSTLKFVTYAAAINEGNYQGHHVFRSGERMLPGNTPISDHGRIYRGEMTFDEGFFRSTNTSIIDLLRTAITHAHFLDYLEAFGFGASTGLPLIGEHAGSVPSLNDSPVDIYTSGFGQGITVTPIQQMQALTAILNDGEMIRPQLISKIFDPNTHTIVQQFEREVVGNPITPETARQVRELMIGVVENEVGTGHINYALDVSSGGKTGTAQIPGGPKGYLVGEYLFSYIGFAPAENPEVMMFIAIDRPDVSEREAHPLVGEVYQFIMNHTLSYLGLTQNQVATEGTALPQFEMTEAPRVLNLSREEAIVEVEALGLTPVVIGNGSHVFNQSPAQGASIRMGDKVFIQTDIEDQIPDFTGWSRAEIAQYAELLDIMIDINGHGFGVRQTLRRGRLVRPGDTLSVTLE